MTTRSAVAVLLLGCVLLSGCSTTATPAVRPVTSVASVTSVTSVTASERAVLQARGRVAQPRPEPQAGAVPVVAEDPASLAQQLVTAERAVRDPAVTGDRLASAAHLQQLAYRRLIERPELRDAVFAAIPADIRSAADLNFAAGADLWLFGTVRVTALPAWHIVEPAPMEDLLAFYREAEAQFGVPWYYLASINLVETRMGRIRGDSYAGAQGPMQFMPATWDSYGRGDINDAHDAILAAGRYLRAAGAPARMDRAIWAYNHDDEYVDAVTKYAQVMAADPSAYRGYYWWQVYFQTANGTVHLPVGYTRD